jgi:uncharacterized membrane protein
MKRHFRYFLEGVVLVAPLAVTVYVVFQVAAWLDTKSLRALNLLANPEKDYEALPFPGMGVIVTLLGVYLIGRLGSNWAFGQAVRYWESLLVRIPLFKVLYSSVRDMLKFVVGDKSSGSGRAVTYQAPGLETKMMGVVTAEMAPAGTVEKREDYACVYFPLSYQLGGITMLVPKDKLADAKLDGLTMMRLAMTGGVAGKDGDATAPDTAPKP